MVKDIRPSQILATDGDIGQNVTIKYCLENGKRLVEILRKSLNASVAIRPTKPS